MGGVMVEHDPDTCAGRIVRVDQFEEFDELRAAMPLAHQTENFPGKQIDASEQGEGSVPNVFMISPYRGVFSWEPAVDRERC